MEASSQSTSAQDKEGSAFSSTQSCNSSSTTCLNTSTDASYHNLFLSNHFILKNEQEEEEEDWMNKIGNESLGKSIRNAKVGNINQTSLIEMSNIATTSVNESITNGDSSSEKQETENMSKTSNNLTKSSGKTNSEAFKLDYDDDHDDLENIFGLSLVESGEQSNSIFRQANGSARGLSPIEFTPPDSPHEELTLDMLFGIPTEPIKPTITTTETFSLREPLDFSSSCNTSGTLSSQVLPMRSTEIQCHSLASSSKKVPVYKQKITTRLSETEATSKTKDPNYDAFEFQDDESQIDFGTLQKNPDSEILSKNKAKTESVYIPGKGFRITNKPRGDTSKKHQLKVCNITNDAEAENNYFTPADSIRKQKDNRFTNSFIQPIQLSDNDCPRNGRFRKQGEPALPKFVICIEKSYCNFDEEFNKRKRSKKRSYNTNDESSDWDEISPKRRKIMKTRYSLHEIDVQNYPVRQVYSNSNDVDSVQKRLDLFGPADGILPKGTYVVCKTDLLNEDCALWRVDNQTLLQKFHICQNNTEKSVYKSSSTYSGWCEQISSQYFRVTVKVLKQTRSEVTIEPEIPLVELFPAISVEMFRTPKTVFIEDPNKTNENGEQLNTNSVALETLIKIYLQQSFSSNYLETLSSEKDWPYFRSLAEINNKNYLASLQIKQRIPIEKKHDKWISEYTRVAVTRSSFHCITKCQICKRKRPRRVIHFFDKSQYDSKYLMISNNQSESSENAYLVVVDAISCGRCSTAIRHLHSMKHIHLHLLRTCEEKLEEIGTCGMDLNIEKTIQTAQMDKLWIAKVIGQYTDMWDEVRMQFRNDE